MKLSVFLYAPILVLIPNLSLALAPLRAGSVSPLTREEEIENRRYVKWLLTHKVDGSISLHFNGTVTGVSRGGENYVPLRGVINADSAYHR